MRARLVIAKGEGRGRVFELEEGNNLIGRWDPDTGAFPEIDLDAEDADAKVSRKHAIIHVHAGRASIEDVGSLNGTFLNRGPRLDEGIKYELHPGDEIIIGKVFCLFEVGEEAP